MALEAYSKKLIIFYTREKIHSHPTMNKSYADAIYMISRPFPGRRLGVASFRSQHSYHAIVGKDKGKGAMLGMEHGQILSAHPQRHEWHLLWTVARDESSGWAKGWNNESIYLLLCCSVKVANSSFDVTRIWLLCHTESHEYDKVGVFA